MPKKTKKSRKSYNRVEVEGNEAMQVFDYQGFKDLYEKWVSECDVSGAALYTTSSTSLLTMVKNHGRKGRLMGDKAPKNSKGAGTIVDTLEKIVADTAILEKTDSKVIQDKLDELEKVRDNPNMNPRNIRFNVPQLEAVNRKTLSYDKDEDVDTIYGHYRNPAYMKYRDMKVKKKDTAKEKIREVPSHWWSNKKDDATPPMWQALFANNEEGSDVVKLGLYYVLQEALKLTKTSKIENLKITIRDSGAGTTAAEIWKIPEVKKWMKQRISSAEGVNQSTGMFRDDKMARDLTRTPFRIKQGAAGLRMSNFVKDIANFDEIEGRLQNYSVRITRRQMRNLAVLAGLKRTPGKETVYDPKIREPEDDEKEAMDVSKSWKEVLSW